MYGLRQDWLVVRAVPDYPHLDVLFADGTEHRFNLSPLFEGSGVLERLRDPEFFARVGVVHGAVTWPDGTDLAPDALYMEASHSPRPASPTSTPLR